MSKTYYVTMVLEIEADNYDAAATHAQGVEHCLDDYDCEALLDNWIDSIEEQP